jgi:integrase
MYCPMSGPGSASAAIAAYAPRGLSPRAQELVRCLVADAAPATLARAKAWLFACSRVAGFAERLGLDLDAAVLLSDATIERLVAEGCGGLSPASVRTLRTNLRAVARSLERYPQPAPVPLPRERAKQPYSEAEIEGYLRLADAQSTPARRIRASALVCLGAGAGVIAGELRHLRGSDVLSRAGGVLVAVQGPRRRSVPVLARYQQRLLEAAEFADRRLIVGGRQPGRRNITDELCKALSADSSLPRLQSGRLRSTWLVGCAGQIGLPAFMQAAGVRCTQRLGDLVAQLPPATEAELVTWLGAKA